MGYLCSSSLFISPKCVEVFFHFYRIIVVERYAFFKQELFHQIGVWKMMFASQCTEAVYHSMRWHIGAYGGMQCIANHSG